MLSYIPMRLVLYNSLILRRGCSRVNFTRHTRYELFPSGVRPDNQKRINVGREFGTGTDLCYNLSVPPRFTPLNDPGSIVSGLGGELIVPCASMKEYG